MIEIFVLVFFCFFFGLINVEKVRKSYVHVILKYAFLCLLKEHVGTHSHKLELKKKNPPL